MLNFLPIYQQLRCFNQCCKPIGRKKRGMVHVTPVNTPVPSPRRERGEAPPLQEVRRVGGGYTTDRLMEAMLRDREASAQMYRQQDHHHQNYALMNFVDTQRRTELERNAFLLNKSSADATTPMYYENTARRDHLTAPRGSQTQPQQLPQCGPNDSFQLLRPLGFGGHLGQQCGRSRN